jgi:hypothetical protein
MTTPNYRRWLKMSDDEARAEFRRLERHDDIIEWICTVVGCIAVGAIIGFGMWLWN